MVFVEYFGFFVEYFGFFVEFVGKGSLVFGFFVEFVGVFVEFVGGSMAPVRAWARARARGADWVKSPGSMRIARILQLSDYKAMQGCNAVASSIRHFDQAYRWLLDRVVACLDELPGACGYASRCK